MPQENWQRLYRTLYKRDPEEISQCADSGHNHRESFFGEKITVSGLITGQDLKEQLSGLDLGEKLLIPCSMLKGDEEIFLDDMTLEELSEALNTEIVIVDTGGRDLVEAVIYPPEHKQTRRRQIYEQTSSSDSGKA